MRGHFNIEKVRDNALQEFAHSSLKQGGPTLVLKKVNKSHQRESSVPQKLGGGYNNSYQKSNILLPLIMNNSTVEDENSINYAPPKSISVASAISNATSALEKEEIFMRSNFIANGAS